MKNFSWHSEPGAAPHWYKIHGWLPNRYLPIVMFGDSIPIYKPNRKGGHRHNHIYNVCNRILFRSKNVRQIDPTQKQKFREVFEMQVFGGMNPWQRIYFLDILKKGKSARITKKRRRSNGD